MRELIASALVCLAACSGGGGASVEPGEVGDFVRETYCNHLVRCGLMPDLETCLAADLGFSFSSTGSVQAAVDAGTITWDSGQAAACYRAIFDPPSCANESALGNGLPPACANFVHGTLPAGASCAEDLECVSQSCMLPNTCTTGTCCLGTCDAGDPPAPLGLGDVCYVETPNGSVGHSCNEGYCDAGGTNVCTQFHPIGDSCEVGSQCTPNQGLGCIANVCAKLPGEGEACSDTTGGDCALIDLECVGPSAGPGTCTKVGLVGDPCSATQPCSNFFTCNGTVCEIGARIGDACEFSSDCFDRGSCDTTTHVCVGPQPIGGMCSSNGDCDSEYCEHPASGPSTCQTKQICIGSN